MPREPLLRKSAQRIGEILVGRGWITNEALGRALDAQQKPPPHSTNPKRIGEILKASGQVTEDQLAQALAEQYHLEFVDLQRLASGWQLDRELYTFKWKHLRILPMRDPGGQPWLLVTESTADEKLILQMDGTVDFARIKFGVASGTVLEQVLAENPASNEAEFPPVNQSLTMPELPATLPPHNPAELPAALGVVEVPQLLRIIGALWSHSATELQRNAVVSLSRGPRFRIEVRQIVADFEGELPLGYVPQLSSRMGRAYDIQVTLPYATAAGTVEDMAWPPVWPLPDLAETVNPLLDAACRVPPELRWSQESLRWMSAGSSTRDALNHHLIAAAGITLGQARVDDRKELWAALRARARGLDANQAARKAWDRWKAVHLPHVDIAAGHVLALTCLTSGILPKKLATAAQVKAEVGPVLAIEVWKAAGAAADDPAGVHLKVTVPAGSQRAE